MTMRKQVTVVIPTHNSEGTISAALGSVFRQDRSLLSAVVVVDDASQDRTIEIVNEMFRRAPPECRVVLLRNDANLGGGRTRNRGIEYASTEVVALLDADDEWKVDHLSASFAFMEAQHLDFVFGPPDKIKTDALYRRGTSPLEFIFVHGGIAQTSSFVFRKSVALRFDTALRKHQDFDFLMTAFSRGLSIGQMKQVTTRYNDADQAKSRVSKQRRPESSRRFLLKWRRQMSVDSRLCFLIWFHFYNRQQIAKRTAIWALKRIVKSKIHLKLKARLGLSVLRLANFSPLGK
ncbi:glycosyltransferase family 2 protein [Bradyrhizobium sp. CB1015]|uniref:glycosyltransferase family 2 protein n=1 Tax=Bradyrhizobium sp. CB1015 TaxID=2976822 RepID=UPI0021AB014D|nr:glycosyltransferase family 2 protein [Bradyrhizobium sp. CB1015]UWU91390.1 glycosyltransferase family 2 protein [Bradyrhizobium sp. CB1015]